MCDVIFPSPETEGSAKLRDALLGMQTGDGRPAIELKNLPPTQGRLFYESLVRILDDRMDRWLIDERGYHPHETAIYKFHHDEDNFPEHKLIRSLYCLEPGKDPVPTVFVTLDEAIDAHAAMEAQRTGGDAAPIREEFIGKLKASPTLTLGRESQLHADERRPALLHHQPAERPHTVRGGPAAPRGASRRLRKPARQGRAGIDGEPRREHGAFLEQLPCRSRPRRRSGHRPLAQHLAIRTPIIRARPTIRRSTHPRPDVQKQWNARTAKAVGAPMARVDSVVRDGRSVPADNAKIAP
ncbi:MAG: hypothetical protein WDN72_10120 [Alphaproteobacteria bacterium]